MYLASEAECKEDGSASDSGSENSWESLLSWELPLPSEVWSEYSNWSEKAVAIESTNNGLENIWQQRKIIYHYKGSKGKHYSKIKEQK